jgi:putative transposase
MRRGNCYDNATMEALWSTLKHGLIYRRRFAIRNDVATAILDYIESFCNRTRLHWARGFKSPLADKSNLN